MSKKTYLTAKEASETLNVSRATLYAYVSRGLIRSEEADSSTRERRYHAEDVEKLAARKTYRSDPAKAAQDALHWGTPMLDSSLTLIQDHRVFYRGRDSTLLARESTFEQVAALLWKGEENLGGLFKPDDFPARILEQIVPLHDLPISARMGIALSVAGAEDLAAYDLSADSVPRTGSRIVRLLASVVAGSPVTGMTIAEHLANMWGCPQASPLINAALILIADHELNASSFAARVAASTDANPYAVVSAGLATLTGFKHGGASERSEAFLRELGDPTRAVADRLRRGERIPGFGHTLYPEGDPRAVTLLTMLRDYAPDSPVLRRVDAVIAMMAEVKGIAPNVDLAQAALALVLDLPAGTPLALFAVGRSVGWIAHAIEQYADGSLIRPRARYTGELPT